MLNWSWSSQNSLIFHSSYWGMSKAIEGFFNRRNKIYFLYSKSDLKKEEEEEKKQKQHSIWRFLEKATDLKTWLIAYPLAIRSNIFFLSLRAKIFLQNPRFT